MNFPGGSICSSNRHKFSRRVYICSSNRHEFSWRAYRKDMFFQGGSICLSNRPYLSHRTDTNFPRNPYLVLEHIRIFQEPLFCYRTHTIFQETPMPRTHRHFPGRYPLSNRYFVNRSRWLLSQQQTKTDPYREEQSYFIFIL